MRVTGGAYPWAFGAATTLVAVLDFAILALAPLWAFTPGQVPIAVPQPCVTLEPDVSDQLLPETVRDTGTEQPTQPTSTTAPESTKSPPTSTLVPPTQTQTSEPSAASAGFGQAPRAVAQARTRLRWALAAVEPDDLRLLPAELRQQPRRWLTFGLSSVHRRKADYLGLTLSHLFDVISTSQMTPQSTAIVVHLADFDEEWVNSTHRWLAASFTDEVADASLHAIHAPKRLYPDQQVVSRLHKFGDPPDRQWWRAKQNLDYAFLMWYCADLGQYYMQLEDDIQVVPSFLSKVYKYSQEILLGKPWIMAAFSKLGFIGKFFSSYKLPGLAEFLLVFHDEGPCDWLVWIYIDILSAAPITATIPNDLEREYTARENQNRNPESSKKKSFRTDVLLYYKEGARLFNSDQQGIESKVAIEGFVVAAPKPPAAVSVAPQVRERSAQSQETSLPPVIPTSAWPTFVPPQTPSPRGVVWSTMRTWRDNGPFNAYPPPHRKWFWTSDTCWKTRLACDASKKFIGLKFEQAQHVISVEIQMGPPEHAADYIRNGTLEVTGNPGCNTGYVVLAEVSQPKVSWQGSMDEIRCLRIRLLQPQKEWVMLRFSVQATAVAQRSDPRGSSRSVAGRRLQALPASDAALSVNTASQLQAILDSKPPQGTAQLQAHATSSGEAQGEEVALAALLATSVGLSAGLAGWASLAVGNRCCKDGVQTVGSYSCWLASFLVVLDVLLLAALRPPSPPTPMPPAPPRCNSTVRVRPSTQGPSAMLNGQQAEPELAAAPATMAPALPPVATAAPTDEPILWSAAQSLGLVLDKETPVEAPLVASSRSMLGPALWQNLNPGIRTLDFQAMRVLGPPPLAVQNRSLRSLLAIGMVANSSHTSGQVTKLVQSMLEAGNMPVVIHAADPSQERREDLLQALHQQLSYHERFSNIRVLHAPEDLYPKQLARRDSIDCAVLLMFAAPFAEYYLQVDVDAVLQPAWYRTLSVYIKAQAGKPWHMLSLSKMGLHRKVIWAPMLPRLAEVLSMFPAVPSDVLLWDFIDIVNNQSAPKSCYIATDAARRKRLDVLLQYHKSEALIEHVGDVSSLEGKVQRIHDGYFKNHRLENTLFDNPPAALRTSIPGNSAVLRSVYGQSGMTTGQSAMQVFRSTGTVSGQPGAKLFVEVVFKEPVDLEIFLLRMGGFVMPAKKGQNAAKADPDLEHVLQAADLEFGETPAQTTTSHLITGLESMPEGCESYRHVAEVGGREVFWRSQQSRPASGVLCVRVVARGHQQTTPLIIRGICVRSAQVGRNARSSALGSSDSTSPSHSNHPGVREAPSPSSTSLPPLLTLVPNVASGLRGLKQATGDTPSTGSRSDPHRLPHNLPVLPEGQSRTPSVLLLSNDSGVPAVASPVAAAAMEHWEELHAAWALTVCLAFLAGLLSGLLGIVLRRIAQGRRGTQPKEASSKTKKKGRTRRSVAVAP